MYRLVRVSPEFVIEVASLLTEQEVSRTWRRLFNQGGELNEDLFQRAEDLLEELRCESPLRHRLSVELEELRKLQRS